MGKIVMVFFAAVACIQLIKPIGWPGLKQRRDAWKLIVAGIVAFVLLIGIRQATSSELPRQKPGGENSQTGEKSRWLGQPAG